MMILGGCGPVTVLLTIIGVLAWVPWAMNRFKYRHIPGPFAPPVLGNLPGLAQHDLHGYIDLCRQRHGRIFKIYIGSNMIVCVADAAIAKRVFSKLLHRHSGIQLTTGEGDWDLLTDGLVGTNGSAWRQLRCAWTPAFSPAALQSYSAVMNEGADALVARLRCAAVSGEEVEVFRELMAMTLDVVGQAAYGMKFDALSQNTTTNNHHHQHQQQQPDLLTCVQAIFQGGGVSNSSNYLPLVLLFPWLARAVQFMAFNWPDAKLLKLSKARRRIRQLSLQLIDNWRTQPQQQQQQQQQNGCSASGVSCETTSTDAPPPSAAAPSAITAAAAAGAAKSAGPGVFQQCLMRSVDKHNTNGGQQQQQQQQLTDKQIIAQFNTFLITSYETTASSILYCIYHIAQHLQVQQRLLQEIDRFGSNKKITYQDLDQFPYVDAVIKETLRLISPGAIATRFTTQPLQLTNKVVLPPGVPMFGCIQCLHRDDDYWPQPTQFRPDRWLPEGADLRPSTPDAYVPFGFGPRLCVGKKFAEQEVATVLIKLYQQYTFELLHVDQQVPLPLKHTFAVIPAQGLRVRVHKRGRE